MLLEKKYKNIQETMYYLMLQILDSVKWCKNNIERMSIEDFFLFMQQNIKFKEDPEGVELIQSSETFFENNYHGFSGYGDCDCFVVTVSAYCLAYKIPCQIILAGRSIVAPVHIYNEVLNSENKLCTFDLTEKNFCQKRFYKYTQIIPLYYN